DLPSTAAGFPVAWHRSFSCRITGGARLLSWIPDTAEYTFSCSWFSSGCLPSVALPSTATSPGSLFGKLCAQFLYSCTYVYKNR
ncbi:hypothetical protein, partial [Bacillus subtilis]|uniref:hypothetical protein n=1 Tax=Bacillus subtilis TaxID=1423 RepID=UPI001BDB9E31